jgi:hypothetical protein
VITPTTGGIALFGGSLFALGPAIFSSAVDPDYLPVLIGATAAFGLGLWDDLRSIGVKSKFLGQAVIAVTAASAGVRPDWVPAWAGITVASVILVASMNGFNLDRPIEGKHLGEVPHDQLPALYNRAQTFAHLPRWYEPMGRVVIEASLCGCEVVTNDRVGAMSFPVRERSDPSLIRTHGELFWDEFESAVASLT